MGIENSLDWRPNEPGIVQECWNRGVFKMYEGCCCSKIYRCRYQGKEFELIAGRLAYRCLLRRGDVIKKD